MERRGRCWSSRSSSAARYNVYLGSNYRLEGNGRNNHELVLEKRRKTQMATIQGYVKDRRGAVISGVILTFYDKASGRVRTAKARRGGDYTAVLDPAITYAGKVSEEGYAAKATDVTVPAGGANLDIVLEESPAVGSVPFGGSPVGSPVGSPPTPPPNGLLKMLTDDPAFNIEADINEKETSEAIQL